MKVLPNYQLLLSNYELILSKYQLLLPNYQLLLSKYQLLLPNYQLFVQFLWTESDCQVPISGDLSPSVFPPV